jgi:hypothetical protein
MILALRGSGNNKAILAGIITINMVRTKNIMPKKK